jgi:hypothetical protein
MVMGRVWGWLAAALLLLLATGCTDSRKEGDWQVSPLFSVHEVTADGRQIEYQMRGEKGRFGFIDAPFVAGQAQKYMWHFWGNPDELVGKQLVVTAIPQGSKVERQVFTGTLGGANLGAVAHTPSTMSLPTPGLWRLNVRVGGKLLGSLVIQVVSE